MDPHTDKHIPTNLKFQHVFFFFLIKLRAFRWTQNAQFFFFQFIWQTQQLFSKLNKNRKGKNNPTLWVGISAMQSFPEESSFLLESGHNFVKPEFQCLNINLNKVKSSENRKGNLNYVE